MTISVSSAATALGILIFERPRCRPVNRSVNGFPMIANTAAIRMYVTTLLKYQTRNTTTAVITAATI